MEETGGKRATSGSRAAGLGVNSVRVAATSVGYFIADTGSDCSILPICFAQLGTRVFFNSKIPVLWAANTTKIATFGYRQLSFKIDCLKREFTWKFFVADVRNPLLGRDFLSEHNLLVDSANNRLIQGSPVTSENSVNSVKLFLANCPVKPTLANLLTRFQGIFGEITPTDKIVHPIEHHIETSGPPAYAKPRRLFGEKLRIAKAYFKKLLEQGIVYRGESAWATPLHMAPKDDPADPWRPCGDYRPLNKQTLPDRYPMPVIADLFYGLFGCVIFSKLDLVNAFHQIPVAKSDQPKTGVTTPFGLFLYRRMPFGLRNASQSFQRLIDIALQDLPFARAYMDDILIASKNETEHLRHLELVFERLAKFNLRLKLKKCQFCKTVVQFVGVEISKEGVKPVPGKVEAILKMTLPQNIRELKRFLGMTGFYHRHIEHFSELAAPLTSLTRGIQGKSLTKISWSEETKNAFEKLKGALQGSIQLAYPSPNPNAELELVTDASSLAAGAVLHQIIDGQKQPLAFFSRKFSERESNKSAFDRELLAVYLSLKHFSWLLGVQFRILTDHKPLLHALTMKNPTPQQARWLSYISEFNCSIHHVAGADNVVADSLSRINAISSDFDTTLAQGQLEDKGLQTFFANTPSQLVERSINGTKFICDRFFRPYVPKPLRFQLFQQVHSLSHPGPSATLRLIKDRYIWPGINTEVKLWAKHCEECQRGKIWRHTKTPVGHIPTNARFHTVHIDLVGPLPPSSGYQYLVTMIDRFTRWTEVVPVVNMSTESVINAFLHGWVSRFGIPRTLISDRGSQFESSVWNLLMQQLGIERKRTTAYHPACNGAIERFHRTLKNSLRTSCKSRDWFSALPLVLLGIRSTISEQGFSPSQLVYGSTMELPVHFFVPSEPKVQTPTTEFLSKFYSMVSQFPQPIRNHNSAHFVPKDLASSKHVWLREHSPKSSLSDRYSGPYEVLSRDPKTVTVSLKGRTEKLSLDRVKPAFLQAGVTPELSEVPSQITRSPGSALSNSGQSNLLALDSVVYAQFSNYPLWPAVVCDPKPTPLRNLKRPPDSTAVRFFETNDFAYVPNSQISPFFEKQTKGKALGKAIHLASAYQQAQRTSPDIGQIKRNKTVTFNLIPEVCFFD